MMTLHTDGGSRGNPGPAAFGFVLAEEGRFLHEDCGYLGVQTNNVAEYHGLIEGLKAARDVQPDALRVYMDSRVVLRQMTGEYAVRNEGLAVLYEQAQAVRREIRCPVEFEEIRRDFNKRADALVNEALDTHV